MRTSRWWGVLSADQVLYSDDFRSNERGFDLLTQVVGRSGRGTKREEQSYKRIRRRILSLHLRRIRTMFILSTGDFVPQSNALSAFCGYCRNWFCRRTGVQGCKSQSIILEMLSHLASKEYSELPIRALRPTPAKVAKVSNKYRYKLMIKCKNNLTFRTMLSRLLVACGKEKALLGLRFTRTAILI